MIVLTDDRRGLLRAALGEAFGGFAANNFPAEDRPKAAFYLERIVEGTITLTESDVRFLVKVVEFALRELGPEEFFTITGYDFDFGVATFKLFQEEVRTSNRQMGN